MRKLKTKDVPAFCRMLKTVGFKEDFRAIAQEAQTSKDVWNAGFELLWRLFDVITEREGEEALYAFLAGPFDMTPGEVGDMDLADLIAACRQLAEENDLLGFFKSAAALMR